MTNDQRDALDVAWESPGGVAMVLSNDQSGWLQVSISDGAVHISATHCRYRIHDVEGHLTGAKGLAEKILSEIEMTLPLARCQITWRSIEIKDA